jgi:hypothetical protein
VSQKWLDEVPTMIILTIKVQPIIIEKRPH